MKRGAVITMRISTIKLFLKDALNSLKRNATLSIASVATVMATLFILGVFLLTVLNVKREKLLLSDSKEFK
jgi:cell division transport system permease protein